MNILHENNKFMRFRLNNQFKMLHSAQNATSTNGKILTKKGNLNDCVNITTGKFISYSCKKVVPNG